MRTGARRGIPCVDDVTKHTEVIAMDEDALDLEEAREALRAFRDSGDRLFSFGEVMSMVEADK